jgi:hypothetical protein
MTIFVGLVDSGVSGPAATFVAAASRFEAKPEGVLRSIAVPDQLRHGSALAEIITSQAPHCRLLNAQVFGATSATSPPATSPDAVAEAMAWVVAEGARLVNLSVGIVQDRLVLRQACRVAMNKGVLLLAAAPARGGPVFPSSYEGVLRISGDARCAPGEISALQNAQADFGAYPRAPQMTEGREGGASYSVGWVTGLIAAYLENAPGAGRDEVLRYLLSISRYHGAERRLS